MAQKSIMDLILQVKRDSEYFIQNATKKNKNFSLEKDESKMDGEEREIRWHLSLIPIFDLTLSEKTRT